MLIQRLPFSTIGTRYLHFCNLIVYYSSATAQRTSINSIKLSFKITFSSFSFNFFHRSFNYFLRFSFSFPFFHRVFKIVWALIFYTATFTASTCFLPKEVSELASSTASKTSPFLERLSAYTTKSSIIFLHPFICIYHSHYTPYLSTRPVSKREAYNPSSSIYIHHRVYKSFSIF